jgi:hypothetical protein
MDKSDLRKFSNAKFVSNNGSVLERMNMLAGKYKRLSDIQKVTEDLDGVSKEEFIESIDFLAEEKYIHLRTIAEHCPAMLADCEYKELEGKPTGKGTRLLYGYIKDDMVEV